MRLVALDLDGTLLPSHKRLTGRARGVVRDLLDAGIAVTLATGRGWTSTERYARELGLRHALVAFEGALVAFPGDAAAPADGPSHPGEVLRRRTLSRERVAAVLAAVADLPRLGWFLVTERHRTLASEPLRDRLHEVAIWDPHVDLVAPDAPAEAGYILHLVGPRGDVAEAQARLASLALADVATFHADFWGDWDQLQVRPAGIGKHAGLADLLARHGLAPEHVLAAGDWHNDVEMLRMARVAVAPANAVPAVREIAHHRLEETCDDDAVVRFLEESLRAL